MTLSFRGWMDVDVDVYSSITINTLKIFNLLQ